MKTINSYSYTNATGLVINIRTEKYGVNGFDTFVTIDALGVKDKRACLFKNLNGEWLFDMGEVNGRLMMVKPDEKVLEAILTDLNTPTEEREQYEAQEADRRQKERQWDNLYNEGGEGFNPYRRVVRGIEDNTPYHKGDNYAE